MTHTKVTSCCSRENKCVLPSLPIFNAFLSLFWCVYEVEKVLWMLFCLYSLLCVTQLCNPPFYLPIPSSHE